MADTTIPRKTLAAILDALDRANVLVADRFPGESPKRQPVHTVYGGAHLFKADSSRKLGAVALGALQEYAPDPAALADALDLDRELAARIYPRVVDKLTREPIEDFRIDFEDGFGNRPDAEEDRFAVAAADEVAAGLTSGSLPPGVGIRIKPLNEELKRRGLRTFDLFLTRLLERTSGTLPPNFVVTLPKITAPEQVAALASACEAFEYWREISTGSLRFELMVETTQAIFAADGSVALPRLIGEGRGRIVAAHFGTYDYTAACSITAAHQHMLLTDAERDENRRVVHAAWRLHATHVRHSLVTGFYQGWDLHPAQFPTRYATLYAFFLEGLDAASLRLRNFVQKAAQATLVGEVFDDAATGQGLLNYFLRAMNCGAITEQEAVDRSGLTIDELRGRSFVKILQNRTKS